jgi:hypothetical protein
LHNPAGAAIRYVDWGLYVVHGVRIPAEIIERPESITVKQIDEEPNSEIRRIMVDTYDRQHYAGAFLVDGNSKQINLDECGTLYLREMGEDEPIVMVKVTNSTPEPDRNYKDYFIRVPPAIKTAREAVAWTFDQSPEDYQPEVQS